MNEWKNEFMNNKIMYKNLLHVFPILTTKSAISDTSKQIPKHVENND